MRPLLYAFLPCVLCAQTAPEPASIRVFTATAAAVRKGDTVTLRWSAAGTDRVRLEPLGLVLPPQGEMTQPVTARSVYWLHVANASGGQSRPLVVDLLPEAVPAAPQVPAPVVPGPVAPVLLPAPPPALAAQPTHRLVRQPSPHRANAGRANAGRAYAGRAYAGRAYAGRAWIQFAAGTNRRDLYRLVRTLRQTAAVRAALTSRARRKGAPLHLLRTGPFPSVREARLRLRDLEPAMRALNLKPIVLSGPPPVRTNEIQYLAGVRKAGD